MSERRYPYQWEVMATVSNIAVGSEFSTEDLNIRPAAHQLGGMNCVNQIGYRTEKKGNSRWQRWDSPFSYLEEARTDIKAGRRPDRVPGACTSCTYNGSRTAGGRSTVGCPILDEYHNVLMKLTEQGI